MLMRPLWHARPARGEHAEHSTPAERDSRGRHWYCLCCTLYCSLSCLVTCTPGHSPGWLMTAGDFPPLSTWNRRWVLVGPAADVGSGEAGLAAAGFASEPPRYALNGPACCVVGNASASRMGRQQKRHALFFQEESLGKASE